MNTVLSAPVASRPDTAPTVSPVKTRVFYAALMVILFCLLTWTVILSGSVRQDDSGAAGDQNNFHYPAIVKMAKAWPHPDLNDVGGAPMAPTFHVIMAGFMHYFNLDLVGLRMVNSFTGMALVVTVFWFTSKCTDARTAFALSVTYLLSPFMLSCASWLMTADFAFFFVTLALAGAAMYPATPGRVFGNGLATTAAAAIRQVHVWPMAPVSAATLLELFRKQFPMWAGPEQKTPPSVPGLLLANWVVIFAPIGAVLFYVIQWHGLVPPTAVVRGMHNHFTTTPLALAQLGFCCFFVAPAVLEGPWKRYLMDGRIWAGAIFCLVIAALPRSATAISPGGAMHELFKTPILFGRILILLPPSALGGAGLTALFLEASSRGRQQARTALIIVIGFFCWLVAQTAPPYALRQYCDIIQVMIIWLGALCLRPGRRPLRFWLFLGTFACLYLAQDIYQIYVPVLWRH